MRLSVVAVTALLSAGVVTGVGAQQNAMTFFITSVGKSSGADLGGLEGADAHCATLTKAAGSSHTNWRAYLGRHMRSWNSSHGSRGCRQDQLKASGGAGLFFAAN